MLRVGHVDRVLLSDIFSPFEFDWFLVMPMEYYEEECSAVSFGGCCVVSVIALFFAVLMNWL